MPYLHWETDHRRAKFEEFIRKLTEIHRKKEERELANFTMESDDDEIPHTQNGASDTSIQSPVADYVDTTGSQSEHQATMSNSQSSQLWPPAPPSEASTTVNDNQGDQIMPNLNPNSPNPVSPVSHTPLSVTHNDVSPHFLSPTISPNRPQFCKKTYVV
jgi:hypothetical protein